MAAVRHLGFHIFEIFVKKNPNCVYFYVSTQNLVKIGRSTAELMRIFHFQYDGRPPSWISYFRNICKKNPNCAYFYVSTQNLVKIGRSTAELLLIFDFQTGGRPPSWLLYDVIADHPRLVFDGPNILLKLHVDRVCTLQDIAIFIFGPFGLKLPIHAFLDIFFWGGGDITPK